MIIIEIAGHLGADPETRFTPSGQKVTSFRVATNVRKSGKDETVWWRVTIWGDRFEKLLPHLKKGSAVIVIGEMGKPEIYTDREGRQQVSLEITAEIIRFSPFGRTDRSGQQQEQHAGQTHTAPHSGVSESSFGNAYSTGMSSGGQAVGQASYQAESEEMPF